MANLCFVGGFEGLYKNTFKRIIASNLESN